MEERLQEIIDFLEFQQGYSKEEVIEGYISSVKNLKGRASDEIGLEWDGQKLMILSDFADIFYEKIIEGVCNVIKSSIEESEDE